MWSHTNPLYEDYEINSVNETVTFTPPAGVVNSYTVSISPDQSLFTATASASSIEVETIGEDLIGLYPFISAHYLEDYDNEVLTDDWNAVPAGKRMVDFIAHPETSYTFTLACVCNWTDTSVVPPVPMVSEISLDVTIWHHYSLDQEALNLKVDEEVISHASSSKEPR